MSTSISIKSEIDSRVLLYPLMRCLCPLGNILVVTSNKQISRLIDSDFSGDFRNFHIVIDSEGATDELLENEGISPEEYTYVVYDNVGVVEQDKLLIPIGPYISEQFETEMLYLGEDQNTHILRFGKPVKDKKPVTKDSNNDSKKDTKIKSKKSSELSDEDLEEAQRLKFLPKKENVVDKLKKLPNMNFISLESIELFEATKIFFDIDRNFIKFFYTIFQNQIGVKEPNFMREVAKKDESSGSIRSKQASW